MTELPDDMEAVVSARLVEVDAHGGTTPFRNAYFRVDVIRALLLAYQERGRALETISKGGPDTPLSPRPKYTDGFDEGCAWAGRIARRALNQKGKSHDQ
jgi:hypothetical protein